MFAAEQFTFKNIPLTTRFKAWWEGYPVDALVNPPKRTRPAEVRPIDGGLKPLTPQPEPDGAKNLRIPWSAASVEAAQSIWGQGFCGPNSEGYIEELSEQMDIRPHTSILQLGAQLGGQAQMLADQQKVKVRGLEASSDLLELGSQANPPPRAHPNMRLSPYDPESFGGFQQKFEGAFSQEALFTVEGKRDLLAQVEDQLRPGGRLSLTEFMLTSTAVLKKDTYEDWSIRERRAPHPVLLEEMKDILAELKLEIHFTKDISPQYNSMVKRAWARAQTIAAKLAERPEGVEKIRAIAKEAEVWQAREKILASGDLKMWRLVARKKPTIRMLSDW